MRKIAIFNQKGGVGKTTTAVNLGACIAELGKRALLIDMDPQANLSMHFAITVPRGEPSVYTLIRGRHAVRDVVRETRLDALKVIPANIDLAGLEVELAGEHRGRERFLSRALEELDGEFDYVFVDSPPSLSQLTLNILCAMGEVFIPLQTEFFALQGLGRLMSTVRLVRSRLNPSLKVTGIVACMFDVRTSLAVEVLQEIKHHFAGEAFDTVVRKNVRLAEAPGYGVPITEYDPRCYGAEDYRSLAREVLAMAGEWLPMPAEDDTTPPLPQADDQDSHVLPLARAG